MDYSRRVTDRSFPDISRLDVMLLMKMERADDPPAHHAVYDQHYILKCCCRKQIPNNILSCNPAVCAF